MIWLSSAARTQALAPCAFTYIERWKPVGITNRIRETVISMIAKTVSLLFLKSLIIVINEKILPLHFGGGGIRSGFICAYCTLHRSKSL